jgi:hypothetical protein
VEHTFTEPTPTSRAGEAVLPIWIESWEIECCAAPPVVGESTTWWLFLVPAGGSSLEPEFEQTWSGTARPLFPTGSPESFGAVLAIDGAAVFCHPDQLAEGTLAEGPCELRGHLAGTWHGGSVPEAVGRTTGLVRRVRVASQLFTRRGDGPRESMPGTPTLTDRHRSPRSFERALLRPGDGPRRQETGVLLDLAIVPGPSTTVRPRW